MKRNSNKLSFRQHIIRVVRITEGKQKGRHYFLILGHRAKLISRFSTYLKLQDFKYKYKTKQNRLKQLIVKQEKSIATQKKIIATQKRLIAQQAKQVFEKSEMNEQTLSLLVASIEQKERLRLEMEFWNGGIGVTDELIILGQDRK